MKLSIDNLNFVKHLYLLIKQKLINYSAIDMDDRRNKLSACKITDQYLKKQKVIILIELWQLVIKKGIEK